MAAKYDAKSIISVKNDRDRIRLRPTIYIVDTHAAGALHIIFEVVDNSVDELSVKNSVGKNLTVTFDSKTKEVTVTDDGRGIPHESLLDVCTVLNTSGKFDNDDESAYTFSGGLNGVGTKTAVYLSKMCEVTSIREGKSLTYKFKDGILVDTIKAKAKGHGTIVKFTIDQKLVEINAVDPADIQKRLHEKSYCFPDINMTYILMENGKEVKTKIYTGETLIDLVKKSKPDTEILEIHDTRKVKFLRRIDDEDITESKIIVDAVISMKDAALDADSDTFVITYANSIKTYDGGTHLEGLKAGLIKYFKEVVIPKLGKKDQGLTIMPSDITAGLCGMVSVKLTKPEFSAQHKARLNNPEVRTAVRDAVFEALCDEKNGVINPIIDFVKRVTRGRMASKKVRKKDTDNAFSKDRPDKFVPITYNLSTTAPELLLCEGG